MALSRRKTTIAVLRGIIGPVAGQEKRFARLASRGPSWVKKVSAGLIPITEETARVLQLETGISFEWLMGSPRKPPVNTRGERYSREFFEWYRSRIKNGEPVSQTAFTPLGFLPDIVAVGSAAGDKGKAAIFLWRLRAFIEKNADEFGKDESARESVAGVVRRTAELREMFIHDKGLDIAAEIPPALAAIAKSAKTKSRGHQQRRTR